MAIEKEKKLVEAAKEGDGAAFTQLARVYEGRVFAYLSIRMEDPGTAGQLVTEVFREIYSAMRNAEQFGGFKDELFKRAAAKLRRYSRESNTRWTKLCLEHDQRVGEPAPLSLSVRKRLEDSITGLDVGERHALELRYGSGLRLSQVSKRLKRSEDAVRTILAGSLKAVKSALKGKPGK